MTPQRKGVDDFSSSAGVCHPDNLAVFYNDPVSTPRRTLSASALRTASGHGMDYGGVNKLLHMSFSTYLCVVLPAPNKLLRKYENDNLPSCLSVIDVMFTILRRSHVHALLDTNLLFCIDNKLTKRIIFSFLRNLFRTASVTDPCLLFVTA